MADVRADHRPHGGHRYGQRALRRGHREARGARGARAGRDGRPARRSRVDAPSGQFGRDSASGAEKPATGESSAEPSTEASTGQGKHRGEPAPESDATTGSGKSAEADTDGTDGSNEAGKPGKSGEERESGRHASRGDDSARGDAAEDGSYTVRTGDNLWAIADEQKVEGGWPALYEANREVVGSDADLILPGQSLDLTANQG